ncbi:MAG: hypothetical protein ACI8PT_002458, partial [Gammaproteobacteria bacterium]
MAAKPVIHACAKCPFCVENLGGLIGLVAAPTVDEVDKV